MAASFLALIVLAGASPAPQTKLNIDFPGGRLEQLAEQIGKAIGRDVVYSPELKREIVVAYGNQVDAEAMIKRLSDVTATKWVDDGAKLTITPDLDVRRAQQLEAQQAYIADLQKALANMAQQFQPRDFPSDEEGGEPYHYEPSASQLLMLQAVRSINFNTLAQICPGTRVVFATTPNRMQRPLPLRVDPKLIQKWIADYNEQLDYPVEMPEPGEPPLPPRPNKITSAPAKMILAISRPDYSYGSYAYLTVTISLIAADGSVLTSETNYLSAEMDGEMQEPYDESEGGNQAEPTTPESADKTPITWSDDAKLLTVQYDYSNMNRKYEKRFYELLRQPDEYEPVRYVLGEGLISYAKAKGQPMVAVPSDSASLWASTLPPTYAELDQYVQVAELERGDEDGWIVFRPTNPVEMRANRVDRVELAELLKSAANHTFLPLDQVAEFMFHNPNAYYNMLIMGRVSMLAPNAFSNGFYGGGSQDMLILYGSMSSSMRQLLKSGRPVGYAQLGADSRAIVDRMIFGPNQAITPGDLETSLSELSIPQMYEAMSRWETESTAEPTELLPNGVNPQMALHGRVSQTFYFVPLDDSGNLGPMSYPMGRDELAYFKMLLKEPTYAAEMGQYVGMLESMCMGEKSVLRIAIPITPNLGLRGELADLKDPDKSRRFGLSNLPPEIRKIVDQTVAEMEKVGFGGFYQNGEGPTIKP